jgi:uncharacterized protein YcsI (UPF0317 family)
MKDQAPTSEAPQPPTVETLRAAIRAGTFTGPTAGCLPGIVQANVVIVPERVAAAFAEFCRQNSQACPLLDQTQPGEPVFRAAAPTADLRTDVPRYRVFRHGQPDAQEPTDICALWRADLVGFLLGCSFTFERALVAEGLAVRHLDQRRNVPMYRTNRPCQTVDPFRGPLVVSMRPFRLAELARVRAITSRYSRMHGAPIHVGEPEALGIADLGSPDFGDPVTIHADEVPVFWACGVTPQLALEAAGIDLAITHSPGCMFLTDWQDSQFCDT